MSNRITLYSQPSCAPCRVAKARLQRDGIDFEEINVQEDENAAERLKSHGFTGTPVFHYAGRYTTMAGLAEIITDYHEERAA